MASFVGGGVAVAHFQFASAPDVSRDRDVSSPRRSPTVWNSRTTPLSDALRGRGTPTIVRDARGGRRDDGRGDVYVHSMSSCQMAVAEGLTTAGADPPRRAGLVSTGRRYLIPVDHRGWFELLSQDGHAAAPIASVQQLIALGPDRCLVRRSVVGLSDDRRSCRISAGETLSVQGVTRVDGSRRQCLRCRLDSTGQGVVLTADQRGQFSPVAGPTDVSGVHRMRSVVAKFRLPVVVRLITRGGEAPSAAVGGVAFRVTAVDAVPTAYVVPLGAVDAPPTVDRRSLLLLPTSGQASSVLDGVATLQTTAAAAATASENWSEVEWGELRRRCDDLIKSRAVTAEMTRLFPRAG